MALHLPDSSWFMWPCIGVCAFEGTNTSTNLYRLISEGINLLLPIPQVKGITSRIAVVLSWSWIWGCHWYPGMQWDWWSASCYQSLELVWIVPGHWMDRNASSILFSKVVLGQVSTLGSIVGSSDSEPITRCIADIAPNRTLERLLSDHWMGLWWARLALDHAPWLFQVP